MKFLDAMDTGFVAEDAASRPQRHDRDPRADGVERRGRGLGRSLVDNGSGFAFVDDERVDLVQESWIEWMGGGGIEQDTCSEAAGGAGRRREDCHGTRAL